MYYNFLKSRMKDATNALFFFFIYPKRLEALLPVKFPSFMTPKPTLGLLPDGVFEQPSVTPCQLTFRQFSGVLGNGR